MDYQEEGTKDSSYDSPHGPKRLKQDSGDSKVKGQFSNKVTTIQNKSKFGQRTFSFKLHQSPKSGNRGHLGRTVSFDEDRLQKYSEGHWREDVDADGLRKSDKASSDNEVQHTKDLIHFSSDPKNVHFPNEIATDPSDSRSTKELKDFEIEEYVTWDDSNATVFREFVRVRKKVTRNDSFEKSLLISGPPDISSSTCDFVVSKFSSQVDPPTLPPFCGHVTNADHVTTSCLPSSQVFPKDCVTSTSFIPEDLKSDFVRVEHIKPVLDVKSISVEVTDVGEETSGDESPKRQRAPSLIQRLFNWQQNRSERKSRSQLRSSPVDHLIPKLNTASRESSVDRPLSFSSAEDDCLSLPPQSPCLRSRVLCRSASLQHRSSRIATAFKDTKNRITVWYQERKANSKNDNGGPAAGSSVDEMNQDKTTDPPGGSTEQQDGSADEENNDNPPVAQIPQAMSADPVFPVTSAFDDTELSRRDSIQKWVNSIEDDTGEGLGAAVAESDLGKEVKVIEVPMETEPTHDLPSNIIVTVADGPTVESDELALGAEAVVFKDKKVPEPEPVTTQKSVPTNAEKIQNGRRNLLLRSWFSQSRGNSFNSDNSGRSYSSIDQILNERTGDPEEILTNLGFGSVDSEDDLSNRIPDRFLKQPSVARGISIEHFLDRNPDLKEFMRLKRQLSQDGQDFFNDQNSAEDSGSDVSKDSAAKKSPTFFNVALTVSLINRFSSRSKLANLFASEGPDKPRANPHSVSLPGGKTYTSILHPDNAEFFADTGHYDDYAKVSEPIKKVSVGLLQKIRARRQLKKIQRWSSIDQPDVDTLQDQLGTQTTPTCSTITERSSSARRSAPHIEGPEEIVVQTVADEVAHPPTHRRSRQNSLQAGLDIARASRKNLPERFRRASLVQLPPGTLEHLQSLAASATEEVTEDNTNSEESQQEDRTEPQKFLSTGEHKCATRTRSAPSLGASNQVGDISDSKSDIVGDSNKSQGGPEFKFKMPRKLDSQESYECEDDSDSFIEVASGTGSSLSSISMNIPKVIVEDVDADTQTTRGIDSADKISYTSNYTQKYVEYSHTENKDTDVNQNVQEISDLNRVFDNVCDRSDGSSVHSAPRTISDQTDMMSSKDMADTTINPRGQTMSEALAKSTNCDTTGDTNADGYASNALISQASQSDTNISTASTDSLLGSFVNYPYTIADLLLSDASTTSLINADPNGNVDVICGAFELRNITTDSATSLVTSELNESKDQGEDLVYGLTDIDNDDTQVIDIPELSDRSSEVGLSELNQADLSDSLQEDAIMMWHEKEAEFDCEKFEEVKTQKETFIRRKRLRNPRESLTNWSLTQTVDVYNCPIVQRDGTASDQVTKKRKVVYHEIAPERGRSHSVPDVLSFSPYTNEFSEANTRTSVSSRYQNAEPRYTKLRSRFASETKNSSPSPTRSRPVSWYTSEFVTPRSRSSSSGSFSGSYSRLSRSEGNLTRFAPDPVVYRAKDEIRLLRDARTSVSELPLLIPFRSQENLRSESIKKRRYTTHLATSGSSSPTRTPPLSPYETPPGSPLTRSRSNTPRYHRSLDSGLNRLSVWDPEVHGSDQDVSVIDIVDGETNRGALQFTRSERDILPSGSFEEVVFDHEGGKHQVTKSGQSEKRKGDGGSKYANKGPTKKTGDSKDSVKKSSPRKTVPHQVGEVDIPVDDDEVFVDDMSPVSKKPTKLKVSQSNASVERRSIPSTPDAVKENGVAVEVVGPKSLSDLSPVVDEVIGAQDPVALPSKENLKEYREDETGPKNGQKPHKVNGSKAAPIVLPSKDTLVKYNEDATSPRYSPKDSQGIPIALPNKETLEQYNGVSPKKTNDSRTEPVASSNKQTVESYDKKVTTPAIVISEEVNSLEKEPIAVLIKEKCISEVASAVKDSPRDVPGRQVLKQDDQEVITNEKVAAKEVRDSRSSPHALPSQEVSSSEEPKTRVSDETVEVIDSEVVSIDVTCKKTMLQEGEGVELPDKVRPKDGLSISQSQKTSAQDSPQENKPPGRISPVVKKKPVSNVKTAVETVEDRHEVTSSEASPKMQQLPISNVKTVNNGIDSVDDSDLNSVTGLTRSPTTERSSFRMNVNQSRSPTQFIVQSDGSVSTAELLPDLSKELLQKFPNAPQQSEKIVIDIVQSSKVQHPRSVSPTSSYGELENVELMSAQTCDTIDTDDVKSVARQQNKEDKQPPKPQRGSVLQKVKLFERFKGSEETDSAIEVRRSPSPKYEKLLKLATPLSPGITSFDIEISEKGRLVSKVRDYGREPLPVGSSTTSIKADEDGESEEKISQLHKVSQPQVRKTKEDRIDGQLSPLKTESVGLLNSTDSLLESKVIEPKENGHHEVTVNEVEKTEVHATGGPEVSAPTGQKTEDNLSVKQKQPVKKGPATPPKPVGGVKPTATDPKVSVGEREDDVVREVIVTDVQKSSANLSRDQKPGSKKSTPTTKPPAIVDLKEDNPVSEVNKFEISVSEVTEVEEKTLDKQKSAVKKDYTSKETNGISESKENEQMSQGIKPTGEFKISEWDVIESSEVVSFERTQPLKNDTAPTKQPEVFNGEENGPTSEVSKLETSVSDVTKAGDTLTVEKQPAKSDTASLKSTDILMSKDNDSVSEEGGQVAVSEVKTATETVSSKPGEDKDDLMSSLLAEVTSVQIETTHESLEPRVSRSEENGSQEEKTADIRIKDTSQQKYITPDNAEKGDSTRKADVLNSRSPAKVDTNDVRMERKSITNNSYPMEEDVVAHTMSSKSSLPDFPESDDTVMSSHFVESPEVLQKEHRMANQPDLIMDHRPAEGHGGRRLQGSPDLHKITQSAVSVPVDYCDSVAGKVQDSPSGVLTDSGVNGISHKKEEQTITMATEHADEVSQSHPVSVKSIIDVTQSSSRAETPPNKGSQSNPQILKDVSTMSETNQSKSSQKDLSTATHQSEQSLAHQEVRMDQSEASTEEVSDEPESFVLEEIDSQDDFSCKLPAINKLHQRAIGLPRTTSVQSDSSGFADADTTLDNIQSIDLDWESLKVSQQGSSEENDQPITAQDTSEIVVKQDITMVTKALEGIPSSSGVSPKRKVVSEKKVAVSESGEKSGETSPSYVTKAFLDPDDRQVSLSDVSEVYLALDGGQIKEVQKRSKSESETQKSRPRYRVRYSDIIDDVFDGHSDITKTDSNKTDASTGSPLIERVHCDTVYTEKGQHKIIADVHQELEPNSKMAASSMTFTRGQGSTQTPSRVNEMNDMSFAEELSEYSQSNDLMVPSAELKVTSPDGKDVKVIPLKERLSRKSKSLQDREIQTDEITQPELLASVLKQSGGWTRNIDQMMTVDNPDLELLSNQGSWTLARKGEKSHVKKHLYDENELVRQALDKYKDDLRILEVQATRLYGIHKCSMPESIKEIESILSIRKAIWHEVNTMSKLLRDRRYSLNGGPDLSSLTGLAVVQQMISLLKEQLFHNDTLDMMESKEETQIDDHMTEDGHVNALGHVMRDETRDDLMRRLAEVQQSVAKRHSGHIDEMAGSLQLFRDSLLAEIKASIQKETQQLQEQVKATERQIQQLNTQLSISSLNSSQEFPEHYVDQYTTL